MFVVTTRNGIAFGHWVRFTFLNWTFHKSFNFRIQSFINIFQPERFRSVFGMLIRFSLRTRRQQCLSHLVELSWCGAMSLSNRLKPKISLTLHRHRLKRNSSRVSNWRRILCKSFDPSMGLWWFPMYLVTFDSTTINWKFSSGVPQMTRSIPLSQFPSIWNGNRAIHQTAKVSRSETFSFVRKFFGAFHFNSISSAIHRNQKWHFLCRRGANEIQPNLL